ncbi:MAG: peptide ABC transporter substrate-binding protein [Actinobacteria bacterium]|nr:peptide ABC transporter substrate-binding protein [Actinomycetota bacterium]
MLYPYLLQYDAAGQIVGDFAKSYAVSKDRKTWTLTTYDGARWSDGKPLTADDVAWTYQTLLKYQDGATAGFAPALGGIASVTAPSPTRVVVRYAAPVSTAAYGMANVPVLPRHVWARYATGSGAQLRTFANLDPVTAGAFSLEKYTPNALALFSRNEGFYGPKPKLASFGFQFFTSNDAMVTALKSNQIDAAYEVPPTVMPTLKSTAGIRVETHPGTDTVLLGINSNKQTSHPELLNPAVRDAIDMAIDRERIVETVSLGTGVVGGSIVPPTLTPWHDPGVTAPSTDVAAANRLLDDAGYRRGSGGIRVADGHPMQYDVLFAQGVTGAPRVIELIAEDLKQIGIELRLRGSDAASYLQAVTADDYKRFAFSVDDYAPPLDPTLMLALPLCGQLGGINESGYCEKEYDAMFAKQATEEGDARVATVRAMQQKIADDKPLLPIYTAGVINAYRDAVRDVPATPLIINYESKQWLTQATVDG